jgi:ATP adenylyltransferase
MNFERLWAPWRLEYVSGSESDSGPQPDPIEWFAGANRVCFLCRAAADYGDATEVDRRLLVADRRQHTLVVLNRYPYNNGHVLVAPRRHVGELSDLTREEHIECMERLGRLTHVYRELLQAEGFNVGLNLGRVAGAGLPGHLHWHLVPRWNGDNNFMGVLAGTRVIPQALDALWELLRGALDQHSAGNNG